MGGWRRDERVGILDWVSILWEGKGDKGNKETERCEIP